MKELEENTFEQQRTLLSYLEQTYLSINLDKLSCFDLVARENGGVVLDKN